MSRKIASWPEWKIAMAVTAGLRVFYSAVAAAFFPFLHPNPVAIHGNALTENLPPPHGLYYAFCGIWERFDTLWFLQIAEHGYDRPMSVVFYPLYPAAIRLVSVSMPTMVAALFVSTVAAFFVFWGFVRLANEELSHAASMRAVFLFCVWPTSFMLFAGYAESLTLALVIWAIVFGREARWELATACGLLAGTARPSGILIFIPLAVMAVRSRQFRSLIVALTPLGLFVYWGWLRWSGRPSVVQAYRVYWGTEMAAPWITLWRVIGSLAKHFDPLVAISMLALILFSIAGVVARRRVEDRCFSAASITHILLRTCWPPMVGTTRYLLLVYPAYLTMGNWAEKMFWRRFVFLCATLFAFNLIWMWAFLSWSFVL